MDCTYVLPILSTVRDEQAVAELREYLVRTSELVEVIVVDGSPPEVFAAHADAFGGVVARHCPPDAGLAGANGKVNGVLTGMRLASHDKVVIADDDVRYREDELVAVVDLLDEVELVRPQNYFDPLPWHARWDTARTLINRAFGRDFPGTLGVRRSALDAAHGYAGDVLFENLELIRTVRARGGREVAPLDLYVRRLPPTTRHFWSQRVRQAYDEFARPGRLVVSLALGPSFGALVARGRGGLAVSLAVGGPVALAAIGRARRDGRRHFPLGAVLLAPAWVAERSLTSWLAVAERLRFGGARYCGRIIRVAAHPTRTLATSTRPAGANYGSADGR